MVVSWLAQSLPLFWFLRQETTPRCINGGNLVMDLASHPRGGGGSSNIPSHFMLQKLELSIGLMGHWALPSLPPAWKVSFLFQDPLPLIISNDVQWRRRRRGKRRRGRCHGNFLELHNALFTTEAAINPWTRPAQTPSLWNWMLTVQTTTLATISPSLLTQGCGFFYNDPLALLINYYILPWYSSKANSSFRTLLDR